MALGEALGNMASNYRFHLSVRGGRFVRLAYLTVYYLIYIVFRWGDRHLRALNWLKASGLSDIRVDVETPDGLRLSMDLHTAFDPLFSIVGEAMYDEVRAFEPSEGDTVLDVGANVGVYATHAAVRVGSDGAVVAVEPHPGNFKLLRENVGRNKLDQVRLVEAAVDEREGEGELFVHDRAINHSLVRKTGRAVPVKLRTLDGIAEEQGLERVDLIKIDTEGNVPEVLRGAKSILKRHKPRVMFEQDTEDESRGIEEFFKELGYESRLYQVTIYAWPPGKGPEGSA